MLSPFPGMDPYLEAPSQWQGIHNTLIVYFAEALNQIMPRGYAARVEDRCRIVQTQRNTYPDVVVTRNRPLQPVPPFPSSGSGGIAVAQPPVVAADAADTPVILEAVAVEPHETYIDIIALKPDRQVIATIELLRPVNKTPGEGQNLYLAKQEKILNSRVHLIEIDLLRNGLSTVAVRSLLPDNLRYDYMVCLHRGGQGPRYEGWLNTLRQRLPRIAVPLAAENADVVLDLQAAVDRFYDLGRLEEDIDYTQPPNPPLTEEDAAWSDALLREKGLRS